MSTAGHTERPLQARDRSYTWEDFVALPDDDRRELIDGELIEVEVPTKIHERIAIRLAFLLELWTLRHGGMVLGSGYKIRVAKRRGVMPDVQYFSRHNPAAQTLGSNDGDRPDLAVEIISPSSRKYDQATKLAWYLKIGVPEYWIVDSDAQTLQRFCMRRGEYVATAFGGSDVFKPSTFPGLAIKLADLWAIAAAPKAKRRR